MMSKGARFTTLTAAMAGMLLALPACPRADTSKPQASHGAKAMNPTEFVEHAAAGGFAEVQLGKLARERAESDEVKDFAKRMVDDHTKANDELAKIAQKKNVAMPKQLDAKHRALYDRLEKLSGKEFDRAFMDAMLSDHRQAVADFQQAAKSSDSDVREFASRTLPTLEHHLASAQQIERTVASSGKGAGPPWNQVWQSRRPPSCPTKTRSPRSRRARTSAAGVSSMAQRAGRSCRSPGRTIRSRRPRVIAGGRSSW